MKLELRTVRLGDSTWRYENSRPLFGTLIYNKDFRACFKLTEN
jgi:hypothetical protein